VFESAPQNDGPVTDPAALSAVSDTKIHNKTDPSSVELSEPQYPSSSTQIDSQQRKAIADHTLKTTIKEVSTSDDVFMLLTGKFPGGFVRVQPRSDGALCGFFGLAHAFRIANIVLSPAPY
jgi:hypothetical protein